MRDYLDQFFTESSTSVLITVLSATLIAIGVFLRKWILQIIRTKRIIHYMEEAYKSKFRSKFFSTEDISSNVNLSTSDVEKICIKSKRIKRVPSIQNSWVLHKYYTEGEETPPQNRII